MYKYFYMYINIYIYIIYIYIYSYVNSACRNRERLTSFPNKIMLSTNEQIKYCYDFYRKQRASD